MQSRDKRLTGGGVQQRTDDCLISSVVYLVDQMAMNCSYRKSYEISKSLFYLRSYQGSVFVEVRGSWFGGELIVTLSYSAV